MEILLRDFRYAVRMLAKTPGFAVLVMFILALGIGANSLAFSIISTVLLRPIPWHDPDRIISIHEVNIKRGVDTQVISPANYLDWKEQSHVFENLAAWRFLYLNLSSSGTPERVQALSVSPSYFSLLGVKAARGRTFSETDALQGHDKVVILSHGLWERRFGADPDIVGHRIKLEAESYTVVGVLASSFWIFRVLDRELEAYIPLVLDRNQIDREDRAIFAYARLRPGISLERAQAEMNTITSRLEKQYPESNSGWSIRLMKLQDQWQQFARPMLKMLLVVVGCVLLIACANVANLMLGRAGARRKEMALRAALGANRSRLGGQFFMESLLLALGGGGLGVLLAFWGIHGLNHWIPYSVMNRVEPFRIDLRVLLVTFALSLLTALLFGLGPALQASRSDPGEWLKEVAHTATEGRRLRRLRDILVVVEVALSMTLLISAGLMIRSSLLLRGIYRGLNQSQVLTTQIWLPRARYAEGRQVVSFFERLLNRVENLPGVASASLVNFPPVGLLSTTVPIQIGGRAPVDRDKSPLALYWVISPEYFKTVGIPVLAGRAFEQGDNGSSRGVVIISRSMAHRFWPGEDPLGKELKPEFDRMKSYWIPESRDIPLVIVGVVGDVNRDGLETSRLPQMYLPYRQAPSSFMSLMLRTHGDPLSLLPQVRRAVSAIDPDQPVFDAKTLEDVVSESFSRPRVLASLLSVFSILALLLAAIGIYSVLSYTVTRRTQEIGIRSALGAKPGDLVGWVVKQGLRLALTGIAVGGLISLAATRVLSQLLFGVTSTDPITLGAIALMMTLVALGACYFPARYAVRVDPVVALKHQ